MKSWASHCMGPIDLLAKLLSSGTSHYAITHWVTTSNFILPRGSPKDSDLSGYENAIALLPLLLAVLRKKWLTPHFFYEIIKTYSAK